MKKWSTYSKSEKRMIWMIIVLLLAVLISYIRIEEGIVKGIAYFYPELMK